MRFGFPGEAIKLSEISGRKYPEYECYIAAGSDIDLVAGTDDEQVSSDGYNYGRAHITVVIFLHKRVFRPKALVVNWHKPRGKRRWNTWPMDSICFFIR